MKFILHRASQVYEDGLDIEINTLEELIELVKKEECAIVLWYDWDSKGREKLTVYDDYLE